MTSAHGTFDVDIQPLPPEAGADAGDPQRLSLRKQFHGDLEATSVGQMLTAGTDVKGSAGYVALERVTGTLHGRPGAFTLQHSGTMTRGAPRLTITVVPDSGSDDLRGIAGRFAISIDGGVHSYDMEYTIDASQ